MVANPLLKYNVKRALARKLGFFLKKLHVVLSALPLNTQLKAECNSFYAEGLETLGKGVGAKRKNTSNTNDRQLLTRKEKSKGV